MQFLPKGLKVLFDKIGLPYFLVLKIGFGLCGEAIALVEELIFPLHNPALGDPQALTDLGTALPGIEPGEECEESRETPFLNEVCHFRHIRTPV